MRMNVSYSAALDLLDGYDHQAIEKPKAKGRSVELSHFLGGAVSTSEWSRSMMPFVRWRVNFCGDLAV